MAKKNAQKNAFGMNKPPASSEPSRKPAPAPSYPPTSNSGGNTRSPGNTSGVSMPGWKAQQLEKERRETERAVEEERKRRERVAYEVGGVVEESVVTLGGPITYQNVQPIQQPQAVQPAGRNHAEVDSTSVAKDYVDRDEQLRFEEERLLAKTKNSGPTNLAPPLKQPAPVAMGKMIKVTWVDRYTNKQISSHGWQCNMETRLPIRAIKYQWNIRNVIWAEMEEPINELPDGFSNLSFEGIPNLKIWADNN